MIEACRRGGGQYTEGWLHQAARRGDAYLLIEVDGGEVRGGLVCQEQNWSGRTVLNVLAATGRDARKWAADLKAFAADNFSVESIVFEGRPGWGRVVPGVRVLRHVYEVANERR